MKIANAFSLNMVQLPAKISAQKISAEQIKEMISDSPVKQLARSLVERGLHSSDDDEFSYIGFGKSDTWATWHSRDQMEFKIAELSKIGLEPTEENFDAVVEALSGNPGVTSLESVIGHADTARIVSDILGVELPANRATVKLQPGEKMIVAQYSGPRLPEGATTLPEGAKIEFVLVEVN